MSGHVVEVINDDRRLMATVAAIYRCLRPGGRPARYVATAQMAMEFPAVR
jgi:hypothetical protein